MWEKVRGAPKTLLSSLRMSIKICVLTFKNTGSMFALIILLVVPSLVDLVFDVFPYYVAIRKFL